MLTIIKKKEEETLQRNKSEDMKNRERESIHFELLGFGKFAETPLTSNGIIITVEPSKVVS